MDAKSSTMWNRLLGSGLPDAQWHARPRMAWLLACAFDLVTSVLYRRVVMMSADHRLRPGSLIVSNHLRDSDVPIIASSLCRRNGMRFAEPLPFFAAREDLFDRAALASVLAHWPWPLPQLLGHIPLRGLLGTLRAQPMRRVREFSFGETVRELLAVGLAQADPAQVFNARGRREIVARLGRLPPTLAQLDAAPLRRLRYANWGLRRLRRDRLQQLAPRLRACIESQLEQLRSLLAHGHSVYFAPEGMISATGRFGRVRAGVHALCSRAPGATTLLPVALSYDALASGRLRVIVNVGAPLQDIGTAQAQRLATTLRGAVLGLCAVNASHLLAHYLVAGPPQFSSAQCAEWLRRATAGAHAAGCTLDPLLARSAPAALAAERLHWLRRKKLLRRSGSLWHSQCSRATRPGWEDPAATVRYLANSFAELCPQLAAADIG